MFKNKKVLAYLLVIVSTLAATMAFYFWQVAYSPNLNVEGKEKFVLYVPKNATYESLMDTLHKHKIINDEVAFGFMTKRMGLKENIRPGRYEIKPNSANKRDHFENQKWKSRSCQAYFQQCKNKRGFDKKNRHKTRF